MIHNKKDSFVLTGEIKTPSRQINVCHIMESLGLGGGQIMMYEMSAAMNKYFPWCKSYVVGTKEHKEAVIHYPELVGSYGVEPTTLNHSDLNGWMSEKKIDFVIHHRVSISKPVKRFLPKNTPYIIVSHTANMLPKIRDFYMEADAIVSVCENLKRKIPTYKGLSLTILNGIENDFVSALEPQKLEGTFKTGRCHRMVPGKFSIESLSWMEKISKELKGHVHYLIGKNKTLPDKAKLFPSTRYLGNILNRDKKFSHIKALDAYFYEIYSDEGASVAVLEALACGVPVIARDKGGIRDLVKHKMNGFIENTRNGALERMKFFKENPEELRRMKAVTLNDFNKRLHVKHCVAKYLELGIRLIEKS